MFEHMLFPVDFSNDCRQTSCYVGQLARSLGSDLTLLHVLEHYDSLECGIGSRCYEDDAINQIFLARQRDLAEFADGCFQGVTVHRVVKYGRPAHSIDAYAREHGIQLIVMPTHGHGLFRRRLAGSVTLKVLHDAACPVWTTAHAETLPARPSLEIRNILCAVDLGPESAHVVTLSGKLANLYGAALCVAHAVPPAVGIGEREVYSEKVPRQEAVAQMNRLLTDVLKNVDSGIAKEKISVCTGVGNIADLVRSWAMQLPADLVVVGRTHVQEHFGHFWSHSGPIIHESPCPVLSV